MAKNSKPILSVLIEEDKRTKFADLARRNNLSMGYLVNKAIDRMLETGSIDIYGDSTPVSAGNYVDSSVGGMTRSDIEELIKSSIVSTDIERLVKSYVDSHNSSVGLTHQEVRDIAAATIKDSIAFERLCDEAAVTKVADSLVNSAIDNRVLPLIESATARVVASELLKTSTDATVLEELVKVNIEAHADRLAELETYTQSQFAAMRDEIKKAISNRSVTTEAVATIETTPVTSPNADREYISFSQLAKQLSYEIPAELKDKPPQVRATALIAFAASLGQSYGWYGKKQKFYFTDGN